MEIKAPREGRVELFNVEPQVFLDFIFRFARSEEIGVVGSQFENEIKTKAPNVGVLGLYACDALVAVLSYYISRSSREQNLVSSKLDIVVTLPQCRKLGVGALLIAYYFETILKKYGEQLATISVTAEHPGVVKTLVKYGFNRPAEFIKSPLVSLEITDKNRRDHFCKTLQQELTNRHRAVKLKCLNCQRFSYKTPWCRSEV